MKFACLLCATMSLGDILPNSNLQRPRRLDPMAAPQQPKKRFHRFGGAVLSPQLRGPRTWLHWSAFLAWWLFRDKIDAFCSGMVSAAAEHGMVRFPLQQTVGQRKKKFNPTMTDKECPKQWCRKATDYWKYVRTECFLNEKKLSTAWHSCALRLPALFLDTHEGCINLLLSRLAAGCSLGLAKSKMHARTRQNKTGHRMHASAHIMLSRIHMIEDSTGKRQSFHIQTQEWYCFWMRRGFKSCCGKVRHALDAPQAWFSSRMTLSKRVTPRRNFRWHKP